MNHARIVGMLLLTCVAMTRAAEPPKTEVRKQSVEPNLEFLEYLGTLESDEENWTDVMNVELPDKAKAKNQGARGKPKSEAAAKSASSEK
ncbi:MAG TPA: hypothetical protein VET48_07440 [Steroidobacteraceae bacterium]|nr:hypothetical protein [Steroidobacteraceae bacterium]